MPPPDPPHPPQRCVVVHTTHNLSVVENVAFHTRGHCFIVEEGAETNNTFYRNLGIWTRRGEGEGVGYREGVNAKLEND